jgi:outer membrane protein OmpA-like peptidoglycan-associated protein
MNLVRLLPLVFLSATIPHAGTAENSFKPVPLKPRPDAARMVSVLRGEKTAPAPANPTTSAKKPAPVIERRSKIALDAAPKGLKPLPPTTTPTLKRGRVPADGVTVYEVDEPSSKTTYLKKGNQPAEGIATPPTHSQPLPMKAGRIPAEGDPVPVPPRPRPPVNGGALLAGGLSGSSGSGYGSGGHASAPRPAAPAEISYRVDASSKLSTDTVKFIKGGVELADRASYDYLLTLAEALASPDLRGERFVVEGHASAEGSDYANLVLSQRRANAIFEFLASRGVSPDRLLAVGHGESQARFADYEPDFLRAQDRQVIVFKLAD